MSFFQASWGELFWFLEHIVMSKWSHVRFHHSIFVQKENHSSLVHMKPEFPLKINCQSFTYGEFASHRIYMYFSG